MALQDLPIARLINVDVVLTPLAAQAQDLSTLLIGGSSDVIDPTQRARFYTSIDAVAADFGTTAPEYLAAVLWFEQAPQPNLLMIGRWVETDSPARLTGGVLSAAQQAIAGWNAITNGSFGIIIDDRPLSITGLNFFDETNLNGVASAIEDVISGLEADVTVVWDANNQFFQITSGTVGVESSIGFITAPKSTGKFTFSSNPEPDDTITLNGTTITFVAAAPGDNQVLIGATSADTQAALLTVLRSSEDAEVVKFSYFSNQDNFPNILYLQAVVTGSDGDSLTIAATGAHITASGATLDNGTGTDISAMTGATVVSSGAYVAEGVDAETALAAVAAFDQAYGQQWYALFMIDVTDDDNLDIAAYIEAATNKHLYGVSTQEAGVLSSVSTIDIAYLLSQLNYNRTLVQYSSSNPYAVCSLFGRALTVNYNGNNTVITLMYKQEPGIAGESVTESQANSLKAKNCNVFVKYNNNTAIVQYGQMCSGAFIDEITGTDWLAITIMTAVYNLLYTSPTKIPQTDAGSQLITNTIAAVCSQAVINGLLAPGVWNSQGFGILVQGGYIAQGFYIYAPPVANQFQADREARKSVAFQVAAKLAGAVHTVDIRIDVNR